MISIKVWGHANVNVHDKARKREKERSNMTNTLGTQRNYRHNGQRVVLIFVKAVNLSAASGS